jgi:hypothetical protein
MTAAGRWAASLFGVIALALVGWQATVVFGHLVKSCGGLDSAGYFGESRLLLTGHITEPVPVARVLPFSADVATAAAAPLGFVPAAVPFTIAPRFPPGFPIVLAAVRALAGASAPFYVAPVLGFAGVICLGVIARARMGTIAGLLGAVLLGCSPVFVDMTLQPMSDAPAMFWTVLAAFLAWRARPWSIGSGVAAGMAILTRPPLALAAAVLLLVTPWQSWRRAVTFAAIVAAFVALLLVLQWQMYGHPLRSGYGTAGELFTWASVPPNSLLQITWLLTIHTPLVVLLFAAGAWVDRAFAWRAGLMFLAVAFPYVIYAPRFEDWEILRFLLPGLPFVFGVCACGLVGLAGSARPVRAAVASTVVALAAVLWSSHVVSSRHVLELQEPERKYPLVGSWFAANTTDRAVAVAALHSGSVRYYSGRATLRMDALPPGRLGETVSSLQRAGYEPYAVLEQGDEFEEFSRRFQPDAVAGLTQEPLVQIRGVYVLRLTMTSRPAS